MRERATKRSKWRVDCSRVSYSRTSGSLTEVPELDAVHDILQSFEVPVIFITAYPESLLTGQRPEPTFLIVKPFEENMVRAIVSQALFFDAKAPGKTLPQPDAALPRKSDLTCPIPLRLRSGLIGARKDALAPEQSICPRVLPAHFV